MITLHTGQTVEENLYHDTWSAIVSLWDDERTREAVFQYAHWARKPEEFSLETEMGWIIASRALITLVQDGRESRYLLHDEVKKVVEAAFEDFGLDLKLRHAVSGQILGRYGPPMSAYMGPSHEA